MTARLSVQTFTHRELTLRRMQFMTQDRPSRFAAVFVGEPAPPGDARTACNFLPIRLIPASLAWGFTSMRVRNPTTSGVVAGHLPGLRKPVGRARAVPRRVPATVPGVRLPVDRLGRPVPEACSSLRIMAACWVTRTQRTTDRDSRSYPRSNTNSAWPKKQIP